MMGMYDCVECANMTCPLCGQEMAWQSKSGECSLRDVSVSDLLEEVESSSKWDSPDSVLFYSDCFECKLWVEVKVNRHG